MNNYAIHCTEDQTKKAIELGAPIREVFYEVQSQKIAKQYNLLFIGTKLYCIPTAEQVINWLTEKNVKCFILPDMYKDNQYNIQINDELVTTGHPQYNYPLTYETRKEATLAAIDAALDYLISNKNKYDRNT